MPRVGTHRLNEWINQGPYQGTPSGVNYCTTNKYREAKAAQSPGCPGLLALAASVTGTRSTHVYREPTVSQAKRKGDHGGVPRVGSQGYPRSLEEAERASQMSLLSRILGSRWHFKVKDWVLQPSSRLPAGFGEGVTSPPGSLSQNPEDPASPVTPHPSPATKRNSPEAADAVTVGKP